MQIIVCELSLDSRRSSFTPEAVVFTPEAVVFTPGEVVLTPGAVVLSPQIQFYKILSVWLF